MPNVVVKLLLEQSVNVTTEYEVSGTVITEKYTRRICRSLSFSTVVTLGLPRSSSYIFV